MRRLLQRGAIWRQRRGMALALIGGGGDWGGGGADGGAAAGVRLGDAAEVGVGGVGAGRPGVEMRSIGSLFLTVLYLSLEPCLSRGRSLLLAGAAGGGALRQALGERGKVALRRWRRGGLFRRGCRSWCICFSYEIFVPIFAPVRNNPPAVRGRTAGCRLCGRCGRGSSRRGGGGWGLLWGRPGGRRA